MNRRNWLIKAATALGCLVGSFKSFGSQVHVPILKIFDDKWLRIRGGRIGETYRLQSNSFEVLNIFWKTYSKTLGITGEIQKWNLADGPETKEINVWGHDDNKIGMEEAIKKCRQCGINIKDERREIKYFIDNKNKKHDRSLHVFNGAQTGRMQCAVPNQSALNKV